LHPAVEVKPFDPRHGEPYVMIAQRETLEFLRLTPAEADLLPLLDGTRTVRELAVARLESHGELDFGAVSSLVRLLHRQGFLAERFVDVDAALARALDPRPPWRAKLGGFVRELSIDWAGAERLVRFCYRNGLRWCFTGPGQAVAAALAVVGFAAFVAVAASGEFHLTNRAFGVTFVVLLALDLAIIGLHELGHAVVLVHHRRRVKSAGFRIYFGTPAFFVDSSDALMLDRGPRMAQSFAGPYSEMVAAGAASVLLWVARDAAFAPVLYQFVFLNYYVLFLNLVPMLELDGYWLLSDGLEMPDLRPRSLAFVRRDLWTALIRRRRLTRAEVGLAIYGLLGLAFTVFCVVSALYFWRRVFGDTASQLYHAGPLGVALLAVLVVFLGGPVLRGLAQAVRAVGRQIGTRLRALRFRAQRRWRIEAAVLLDESGTFGDVPAEVLSDIAGRFELRRYSAGQVIVRQGEAADAWYLVRRGTARIVSEHPDGRETELRTLGRGVGFGEVGLATGAARNATVRAVTPMDVFVLTKGAFDRLLADRVVLRAIEPTLAEMAELEALPPFAHLDSAGLRALAERGTWLQSQPGQVLMTQGEPGDAFYVIASGRLEVVQDGAVVREPGPGDHVGEVALLTDAPRNATVRAVTPGRLFRLDRAAFGDLVAGAFTAAGPVPSRGFARLWDH
jgi:putative peptide zinc metalloprotease protein